ncbi:hypothetical protein C0993_012274 [Termitomyces sp. T159_Od127]|nr:hypothetical protein C0993_012274 [Termitomyces sp. T159_Od127]
MTFDGVKVLALFRAFYEELGRKFDAWTEDTLARTWAEISSEHDDWTPKPSMPTPEVFVKECRVAPLDFDIMGMRGVFHKERVEELVQRFGVWWNERFPGVRAFQSTYDRCELTLPSKHHAYNLQSGHIGVQMVLPHLA